MTDYLDTLDSRIQKLEQERMKIMELIRKEEQRLFRILSDKAVNRIKEQENGIIRFRPKRRCPRLY